MSPSESKPELYSWAGEPQPLSGGYVAATVLGGLRVRELIRAPDSRIGVPLMRDAFREGWKAAWRQLDQGELEARSHLFAGAVGALLTTLAPLASGNVKRQTGRTLLWRARALPPPILLPCCFAPLREAQIAARPGLPSLFELP